MWVKVLLVLKGTFLKVNQWTVAKELMSRPEEQVQEQVQEQKDQKAKTRGNLQYLM